MSYSGLVNVKYCSESAINNRTLDLALCQCKLYLKRVYYYTCANAAMRVRAYQYKYLDWARVTCPQALYATVDCRMTSSHRSQERII